MFQALLASDLFTWVILPFLIFLSRIIDVSMGTLRIILVAKGHKVIAPVLGFFEVLIWLLAIGQVMQNLHNMVCFIAYAGGFAAGNYVGMKLEEKLALGMYGIRIFLPKMYSLEKLKKKLTEAGFGVTIIKGYGAKEEMSILYSIFKRKDGPKIAEIIENTNKNIFYTIEEVKSVNHGVFPKDVHRKQFRALKSKK